MQLDELISELRSNILHDRSDRISGSSDYLWTDETLVRYIDEAQRRLARGALLLRDAATPEVTQISLVTGQTQYDLHESVLSVMSARVAGDVGDLARSGHAALDMYVVPDTSFYDTTTLAQLAPGKPLAFSTDEGVSLNDIGTLGRVSLRVYPEPTADYSGTVVNMRVVRMPIERLSATDMCAVPEVPEEHHLEMLDWAAYLALRVADLDAGMPQRAAEFRASFEAHVRDARRAALRKLFAPTKYRFGQHGFTWSH